MSAMELELKQTLIQNIEKGKYEHAEEEQSTGEFINNQYIFIFEIPYIVCIEKFSLLNVFGLHVLTTYIGQTLYKEMCKK